MSRYRDENTESKIYVGDLPRDAEERELERSFGHYGPLKSVWVARNPPGFAFIEFEDPRDAEDAVRALDGTTVCGVRIRVEHATGKKRPKPWNRGGSGGGGGSGGRGPSRHDSGSRRGTFDPNDRCFTCNERGHYSYDCPRTGGSRFTGGRKRSATRSRSRDRKRSYSRSASRSPPRGGGGGRDRGRSPRRSASRGSRSD